MKRQLLIVALAAVPACSLAQTACTPLTGMVHDSSAALIPGATLTLEDGRTQISGADGRYLFPCVASGTHSMAVHRDGFADAQLSFKSPRPSLDATLAVDTVQTVINVEAEAQELPSANSVGATQTISGARLQQLADDPDDLLRQLQQMAGASGGNPANATIAVDGFQDSSTLPPKTSIAYIKVNPDLFSAEYREPPFGNGGRIEVYTKPGQKAFHGALFTTNGSPFENARDPFSTSKAPIGKQRYGFEFGGPIRKTGSDFFTSLEYRRIDNFAVVRAVQLDTTGAQIPATANIPAPQRLWLPTARLDWQLGPKNTLIVSYTGNSSNLRNVGVGGTTLAEAGYNAQSYDHTARVTDVTTVSARLMHEVRASFRFFGQTETPFSSAPSVQVAGAFSGGGSTSGPLHYNRLRMEIDDDFILTTKSHTIKAGTQFFFNNDHRTLTDNFNGTYTFGGGSAPVLDANNQPTGATTNISGIEQYRRAQLGLAGGTPTVYTVVSGDPQVNFTAVNNSLFVQDDWKLPHGVMISSGLRWYTQTKPTFLDSLTPRLGIQWAPGKDPKWTLHAHAGMFAAQTIPNEYAEVQREDGVHRITSLVYNPNYRQPLSSGATVIHSQRTFAPGLSNISYAFYNIGGTRNLPFGFTFTTDLGYGRLWNYIRSNNINAPLNGSPYGPRPFAANLNIYQVQNSGQGRVAFEFFGFSNFKYKRANFFAGAVHIDQIDNTNDDTFFTPQNSRSEAGEFARRSDNAAWQVFSNFTLNLPFKVALSGNLNASGNQPYNITTGQDNNGDGVFNDRPQIAAPGTVGATQTRYGLLVASGGIAPLGRNRGVRPWRTYFDANLQRAFKVTRNTKAEHQQTLTANIRSSNLLNHTNVTAVGSVLNSPLFGVPFAADSGRRIEAGLRYSF
jgi:hypothetical protein